MKLDFEKLLIFIDVIIILESFSSSSHASATKCDHSCGSTLHVPFPFGFSSGCAIQLNCTTNGTISIGSFSVQKITSDAILVNLPAQCNRPLESLHQLYNKNFAPTAQNGILLHNCVSPVTGCLIPTTMVKTSLEMLECGTSSNKSTSNDNNNNTISCYSEQSESKYIHYENVKRTNCQTLVTAISSEIFGNSSEVSLDVQVVQLGWWLQGSCHCSDHATCTLVTSPVDGMAGYRCSCNEGYAGDGFPGGLGCRKESGCNASKYLSGHCGGTARIGILIGGVAAGALFMVSFGLLCCFLRRRASLINGKRRNSKLFESKGISIHVYPYRMIEKATHSFSDKHRLGTGAYGTVYAGELNNANLVAIKRMKHRADNTDNIEQVMNEIKLLSSINHPNLVRLLGCSIERGEEILVYEYMPNGTLFQHLHGDRGSGLLWRIRLTIALETAQAIAYLHSVNPPIYHRDIKSSNILLDNEYKTKVADFGLSRLGMTESSHISTAPQGTPGYLDPQYHQNFHLSDKSDVYSFGVVLVEIITALKAVDFTREQNEVNLASFAIDRIGTGRLVEIIDPLILQDMDDFTILSLHKVAELAFTCLAFHSDMRPSMTEVASELEQISRISKNASIEENTNFSLGKASYNSSEVQRCKSLRGKSCLGV